MGWLTHDFLSQKTAQNDDAITELNRYLLELAEILASLSKYTEADVPSDLRGNVVGLVEYVSITLVIFERLSSVPLPKGS